jgi:ribokinase
VNKAAAILAKNCNSLVILDLGGKNEALDVDILKYVDFLSPNETEIKKIFDMNNEKLTQIFH